MFEKFILPVGLGILSSLIANWITAKWIHLSYRDQLIISVGVGIITMAIAALVFHRSKFKLKHSITRVLSGSEVGGKLQSGNIAVASESERDIHVLTDNKTKGDLIAGDVNVGRNTKELNE